MCTKGGRRPFAKRDEAQKKMPKRPSARVRVVAERGLARHDEDPRPWRLPEADRRGSENPVALLSCHRLRGGRKEGWTGWILRTGWFSEDNSIAALQVRDRIGLWDKLFGEGLARTMNDFGVRVSESGSTRAARLPLASDCSGGWDGVVAKMIETIVTSATYQQAPALLRGAARSIPPTSCWRARTGFGRKRRSCAIFASRCPDSPSDTFGGPSVFPPLPAGVAALSYSNKFKWNASEGENRITAAASLHLFQADRIRIPI